jgi:hypothetical protein
MLISLSCDGDDAGQAPSTPSRVDSVQALATVVIADGTVTSSVWGYAATLPPSWSVSSNFIQSEPSPDSPLPRYGGDALFAPETDNGDRSNAVRANIAITCDDSENSDIDTLISEKVQLLQSLSRRDVTVSDHSDVAGHEAKKIEYAVERDELRYEKVEVYFITERCIRLVALTAQPGDRARFLPTLETLLSSFEEVDD